MHDLKGILSSVANIDGETNSATNESHKNDLARVRNIMSNYFIAVESHMSGECDMPWGDKETAITVVYKLSQVMLRLIPLERKIRGLDDMLQEAEGDDDEMLTPNEVEILSQYVMKNNDANPEA